MSGRHEDLALDLRVNNQARTVSIDPRMSLLQLLRDRLGLTGTHAGCLTGDCGACTVRVDGKIAKSCLLLAAGQRGADVQTIEGIAAADELHPLQQAFWDEYGFQCGYCLPGMLFSALDLIERTVDPTESDIRRALDGCLCRCTGYESIVRSVQVAVSRMTAIDTVLSQSDTRTCHTAEPREEEPA